MISRIAKSAFQKFKPSLLSLQQSFNVLTVNQTSASKDFFYNFPVLDLPVDTKSTAALKNKENMDKINTQFKERLQKILSKEGYEKQKNLLKQRNKLEVRDRITKILDPGSPFLELSQFAGYDLYEDENILSGGMVTGIGIIEGKFCMIVANDPVIKGGTYYPITVKKHIRAQEIAQENKLPCVYLVDSGGAFLPKQDEVFPDKYHFGRIFYNQGNMSSQNIPQISAVLGSCTAGGAYVPAMSDESVIVKGNGTIFLGGPPLVKAATGEIVSAENLGGATVHTSQSGVADHFANNELEALQIIRNIVKNLNTPSINVDLSQSEEPKYDPSELNYIMNPDLKQTIDSRKIIARIVDGSKFQEFKKNYGQTLITGFAKLYGQNIGIVANNGILLSESAQKGAHFIELCSQRKIPLFFLQNITGFMVGKKYEWEGIAKHGAKLVTAVSTTQVPKITLIFGGSFGAGNYGMCGRAFNGRFLFSWPNSKISVMGGEQAAGVLTRVKRDQLAKQKKKIDQEAMKALKAEITAQYEYQSNAYYASARLWDDGIILPEDTRKILGLSLLVSLNKPIEDNNKFGVFRM